LPDISYTNPQSKDQGSRHWFQQQWTNSITARRYLYPKAVPTTQLEIFEREKAIRIDSILASRGLAGGQVLEYGCGTAGMSVYLANRGFHAVATDVSIDALKLANLNVQENGQCGAWDSFYTSAADVYHLPFPNDVFDITMSHGLLEHFNEQFVALVLREILRVLRPGGLFLADISHGCFSVRKIAKWLNLPLALGYYLLKADFDRLRALLSNYFDGFYENHLGPRDWREALELAGLVNVEVEVNRPFPPFSLTPALDRRYVAFLERLLPFWHWFDSSQSWFTRHWGWLYLAYGSKP
jgi:SAM-dependent methyltransferase